MFSMKKIPLGNDRFALIDDEDWSLITSQPKWHFNSSRHKNGNGYAFMRQPNGIIERNGTKKYLYKGISMHRFIMNAPAHLLVDHRNGNGLDNRRLNLRICTRQQNIHSRAVQNNNKLGMKGVSQEGTKYTARIAYNGKQWRIGVYPTKEEAAIAYNEAAREYHGEFVFNPTHQEIPQI